MENEQNSTNADQNDENSDYTNLDENENGDDNFDANENFEEENENENFDDNEMIIDTGSGSDLGFDDSDCSMNPTYSIINTIINTYSAFMFYSPATIDLQHVIKVDLPTYFLPLSLQSVYGFNVNPVILNIEFKLDGYDWTKPPVYYNIQHPVYKNNFVGRPLILDVISNFFDKSYQPRLFYRSESYLLCPTGKPDLNLKMILESEGFDSLSSERALIICSNDIEQARDFLCTGLMPVHDSILSIDYASCPLLYLMLEIADCFLDLQDHCCICRAKMSQGLKPSVCSKQVCNFQLNQIGLGGSVVQEIQRDPLAADLLVSLFSAAVDTEFLQPAPPQTNVSFKATITSLPSMTEMARYRNDMELLQFLKHEAFDLLRWILLSNRSQLISLPEKYKLTEFPGTFQFMTLISTPEAENVFKDLKNQYGSIFLWHGSNGIRWHSIIRNGLKNCTGTKWQANGAALGSGIYMARSSGNSWNYSQVADNHYKASKLGKKLHIIGLCEVANMIDKNSTKKQNNINGSSFPGRFHHNEDNSNKGPLIDHGWAHTLTKEEACVVRFLFVESRKDSLNDCIVPFTVDIISKPPKKVPTLRDLLNYLSHHD